ncbi:MAG: hypothetical protein QM503_00280 [Bacteroidota bacterium]
MKICRLVLILLLVAISHNLYAAGTDGFVIAVDTSNLSNGSSTNKQFRIPTIGVGYNFNVDCNADDAPGTNTATALMNNYTCNYSEVGIYIIRISDNSSVGSGYPRIYFNNGGDKNKIINVLQWGTGHWTSMAKSFWGSENMFVTATDTPDLSNVTSLGSMFFNAALGTH